MDTVTLAFDEFGTIGNPPIVILHGFFASSRNWRQIARKLGENYHVFVPDLRNHGASAHSPSMDYPHLAADVADFLDRQGLKSVTLLGHSMGGKVAMWFALHYPEKIDDLIIVDIAPVSYQHSFDVLIQALMDLPLEEVSNRRQAEELLSEAVPDQSFRQFLLQNLFLSEGEYAWKINLEIFKQTAPNITAFPTINPFQTFTEKALFVTGTESNYILPKYADAVYSMFPSAIIKKIPETGHWLHVQAPQAFIEIVENHLN